MSAWAPTQMAPLHRVFLPTQLSTYYIPPPTQHQPRRKNDMRMNTRSRVRRVFGVKKMGETYIITELESTLSESTLNAYTTP